MFVRLGGANATITGMGRAGLRRARSVGHLVVSALSRNVVAEWVRAQRLPNPVTKLILQLAFDHAGPQEDDRWVCWVGCRTLAWEACLADGANGARTVRRHLSDLEKAGVIEREERTRGNGSQTTNRIVLLVPADWEVRGGRTPESGGGGLGSPPQKPQEEAPVENSRSAPASDKTIAPSEEGRADVQALCEQLAARVTNNGYTVSDPLAASWQTPIRQLLDRDRDPKTGAHWTSEQVAHVIDHATSDPFWMLNVRSPAKLRKHFERFVIAIRAASKPAASEMQAKQDALVAQVRRFEARAAAQAENQRPRLSA